MAENKNAEQWRHLVYFDSESDLDRHSDRTKIRHKPKLICSTFVDRLTHTRRERDFDGAGCSGRFYDVLSASVSEHSTVYAFAHNVGYDLAATGGIKHLTALGWRVDSLYEKGFTYILRLRREGQRSLIFLSSTQFWTSKLADVAPLFGLKKFTDIGFDEQDFEKLRTYCRQDTLIVECAMEWLQDFVHDNDLGGMAMTLPSLAMKCFRHKFMPFPPTIHNHESALILERANYHGGRTEAWQLGRIGGMVYKLDVNSMYPWAMWSLSHPTKLLRLYTDCSVEQLLLLAQRYYIVADVTVRTQRRLLAVKRTKLLFPTGTFKTVINSHELGLLAPHELIQVRGVAVYEAHPLFHDFIEYFYNERVRAKAAGEDAREKLLKLLMNALYGKFGQRSTEWVKLGEAPAAEVASEIYALPDGRRVHLRTFGGATWVNDGAVMESFESFPAIAASVTSAARMLLWNYIQTAGEENVYYMDTDSLFVSERGYLNLVDAGAVDSSRLGALKLEGQSDDVEIFGAKNYRFGTESKHKGIPKDAEYEDGKAVVWTWPKIATFLREGNLDGFENRKVLKAPDAEYSKGTRTANGRVDPIVLEES